MGRGISILKKVFVIFVCAATLASTNVKAFAEDRLDEQIENAKEEVKIRQDEYDAAMETYDRGSLGFVEWMLSKDDLTEKQIYDLNRAKSELESACEEDFSRFVSADKTGIPEFRNDKVVCLGDDNDATSLKNTKKMFPMLNEVNARRDDDANFVGAIKRNPAKTSFYFMAIAQTGANRGAVLKDHSYVKATCENLAFTSRRGAVNMWYNEIGIFNEAKTKLGYTTLTSEEQVRKVESEAGASKVGHYTNLFLAKDQLMGIGYTAYGYVGTQGTESYEAARYNEDSSKFAAYTIDEFEVLFDEYCNSLRCDELKAALEKAKEYLKSLEKQKCDACSHVFGEGEHIPLTCTSDGGIRYVCSKCNYTKYEELTPATGHDMVDGVCQRCGVTGPKKIKRISWRTGDKAVSTGFTNMSFEVGYSSEVIIYYETASKDYYGDEFVFDIGDTDIVEYDPDTNRMGYMNMKNIGETTVSIYPKADPSLKTIFTIDVTDVGGHDYVYAQAEPGSGVTSKTCSKCGMTKNVRIPSSLYNPVWYKDGGGFSEPPYMEAGDRCEVVLNYDPQFVDALDFVATSSDETVAVTGKITHKTSNCIGIPITAVGVGVTTIRISVEQDPSVYKEFTLDIEDSGGHDFVIKTPEDGVNETTKTCRKCGGTRDVILPNKIEDVSWRGGGNYTYNPVEYEIGSEVKITIYAEPANKYLDEFDVISADPDIIQVVDVTGRTGELKMTGTGVTKVTVCGKYNPWVKKEYEIEVTEQGGHEYTAKIVNDETLKSAATCYYPAYYFYSCKNCGKISSKSWFSVGESKGHEYEPEYVWNDSLTACTLKLVCKNDESHVETHKMYVYSLENQPTCENDGSYIKNAFLITNDKEYSDTKVTGAIDKLGHDWDPEGFVKEPDCEHGGIKKFVCLRCGEKEEREVPAYEHSYTKKIVTDEYLKTPANQNSAAEYYYACCYCNKKGDETYTYGSKLKTDLSTADVRLSKTAFVYDGEFKKPEVMVTLDGRTLVRNQDYVLVHGNNMNAGTAVAMVIGTGDYEGEVYTYFKIYRAKGNIKATANSCNRIVSSRAAGVQMAPMVKTNCGNVVYSSSNPQMPVAKNGKVTIPAKYAGYTYITIKTNDPNYTVASVRVLVRANLVSPSLARVCSTQKKTLNVSWKKTAICDGYQIQYSRTNSFASGKYKVMTVKGNAKTNAVIKGAGKLQSGKVYYVRVRAFKNQSGTVRVSGWSKALKVKVK